jgi:hypothetical protein
MNTAINQNLFRHRETKSAAFNNLCTIIHKLPGEGIYRGEVVQGKRSQGTFHITCDPTTESSQVNIDLSAFDALFRANVPGLPQTTEFAVGKEGYIVFHATGHHDGLYVKLTKLPKEKQAPVFDSRQLGKGDIVAFRLWHAGPYTITNELGGQKASVAVRDAENGKYPDLTKMDPVRVTLSDKGFDPARIEKWPVQALVVSLETTASLTLRSAKEPTEQSSSAKSERLAVKKAKRR